MRPGIEGPQADGPHEVLNVGECRELEDEDRTPEDVVPEIPEIPTCPFERREISSSIEELMNFLTLEQPFDLALNRSDVMTEHIEDRTDPRSRQPAEIEIREEW